jgi:hypothetical protein
MSQVPFRILRFFTDYETTGGKTRAVDKVEYCAPGMAQRATTVARIADLRRVRERPDPDDVAGNLALNRWRIMQPAYEAWKQGHQAPDHGTPLGAWPGLSPQQAEVLRTFGIRTVEEMASASDAMIGRVQLPGARELQSQAKRFLDAQDASKVTNDLARKDAEIAELRGQVAELIELIKEDQPKRRGRPPKSEQVETEGEAA